MHWVSGYAELHCHANFSFLDGASHPEDLVETAVELGYQALAVIDHNGFYGVHPTGRCIGRAFPPPLVSWRRDETGGVA